MELDQQADPRTQQPRRYTERIIIAPRKIQTVGVFFGDDPQFIKFHGP